MAMLAGADGTSEGPQVENQYSMGRMAKERVLPLRKSASTLVSHLPSVYEAPSAQQNLLCRVVVGIKNGRGKSTYVALNSFKGEQH